MPQPVPTQQRSNGPGIGQIFQIYAQLQQLKTEQERTELAKQQAQASMAGEAMRTMADLPMQARGGVVDTYAQMFPQLRENLMRVAANTPENPTTIRSLVTQQYFRDNPQAIGQLGPEAASVATTGMNRAGVAQSGAEASILDQADTTLNPDMRSLVSRGLAARVGNVPLETTFLQPGQRANAATNAAGITMTAAQAGGLAVSQAGLREQYRQNTAQNALGWADLQARMQSVRAAGGITPAMQLQALEQVTKIVQDMSTKPMGDAALQMNTAVLNQYLPLIGLDKIQPGQPIPTALTGLLGFGAQVLGRPTATNQNYLQPAVPGGAPAATNLIDLVNRNPNIFSRYQSGVR